MAAKLLIAWAVSEGSDISIAETFPSLCKMRGRDIEKQFRLEQHATLMR